MRVLGGSGEWARVKSGFVFYSTVNPVPADMIPPPSTQYAKPHCLLYKIPTKSPWNPHVLLYLSGCAIKSDTALATSLCMEASAMPSPENLPSNRVTIGGNAQGNVIQTGDQNIATLHYEHVQLASPQQVDIQATLTAFGGLLAPLV